jgi:micrococcal nuclease
MNRSLLYLLITGLLFMNGSCGSKSGKRNSHVSDSYGSNSVQSDIPAGYYSVIKVVDGDTFWVDDGSPKGMKIRVIGVDAPESRNAFKKVVGYFGKEAKHYMTSLIGGKYVRLEYDVDRLDQYQRTLAYVYLEDGTFINAELVKNGYAMVMTVPPNVKYADEFLRLQQEARENNRGLWKATN